MVGRKLSPFNVLKQCTYGYFGVLKKIDNGETMQLCSVIFWIVSTTIC